MAPPEDLEACGPVIGVTFGSTGGRRRTAPAASAVPFGLATAAILGTDTNGFSSLVDADRPCSAGVGVTSVAVPFAAAREQRLHLARGAARRKASGGGPRTLPFEAIVTAAACHLRLRMPYRLLAGLLGAHESTISLAAGRATPLLAAHGITPHDGGIRISTLGQLREHAADAGITLTMAHHDRQ